MPEYENDEEDDVVQRSMLGAYTPPADKYGSSIITLTNPKDILGDFELFLRCLRENDNGDLIKIGGKDWKPLLNELGINAIMSSVVSVINQMNTLSNYEEPAINYLFDTLKENLIQILLFNRISYDVDRKNRDLILGNALRASYCFALRAFEEGDKKFWKGSMVETRHTQEMNKPHGGQASIINPFTWGKK